MHKYFDNNRKRGKRSKKSGKNAKKSESNGGGWSIWQIWEVNIDLIYLYIQYIRDASVYIFTQTPKVKKMFNPNAIFRIDPCKTLACVFPFPARQKGLGGHRDRTTSLHVAFVIIYICRFIIYVRHIL